MASILRNILDAGLVGTIAIPAQNTNADSTSIDLGQTLPYPVLEGVDFLVTIPAQASMTTGQTITATVQDSADNSTFAAVTRLATVVQTGASSAGPLTVARIKMPPSVRRYVRINVASSATAGGSLTGSATIQPVF